MNETQLFDKKRPFYKHLHSTSFTSYFSPHLPRCWCTYAWREWRNVFKI